MACPACCKPPESLNLHIKAQKASPMIDLNSRDRISRLGVRCGFIRNYRQDDDTLALRAACQVLPGFTAQMAKSVRPMSPESAFEKSVAALMAGRPSRCSMARVSAPRSAPARLVLLSR